MARRQRESLKMPATAKRRAAAQRNRSAYAAEYREVEALFDAFKRSGAAARKTLAREICRVLKVHNRIAAALSGLR
jgi:hypothetical protein